MPSIAIVYFSAAGHTKIIAEAVQAGAAAVPGVTATLLPIEGAKIVEGRFKDDALMAACTAADTIVFGCPTYMGGAAAQFKAFIDAAASAWFTQAWKDKLAAGFTHSMSPSGDKLATLQCLYTNAMQQGMIWIGQGEMQHFLVGKTEQVNRLGSSSGLMAQSFTQKPDADSPNAGDRLTAELFGKRIANATLRWTKGK